MLCAGIRHVQKVRLAAMNLVASVLLLEIFVLQFFVQAMMQSRYSENKISSALRQL